MGAPAGRHAFVNEGTATVVDSRRPGESGRPRAFRVLYETSTGRTRSAGRIRIGRILAWFPERRDFDVGREEVLKHRSRRGFQLTEHVRQRWRNAVSIQARLGRRLPSIWDCPWLGAKQSPQFLIPAIHDPAPGKVRVINLVAAALKAAQFFGRANEAI